ncbi:osiris 7 [Haematobia irritans]|uniref:osiris 7 n=1 Tax=Haematobia irritans TaxID=7368 RepID=UPI003F504253
MAHKFVIISVVCLVSLAAALPAEETRGHARNAVGSDNDIVDSIYNDCLRKDSVSCVKYKLFNFVDKVLGARDQFALTEGVTVVRSPDAPAQDAARSISGNESFESLAMSRIASFLNTHTIKVELNGADIVNAVSSTGRALEDVSEGLFGSDDPNAPEESRGKKKKAAKILGPIIALIALKAAALLPLLLGAIALIAGKALLIGKIALVLSAVIGLKKLLSQEKHVTYEVVAHPHHSSSHSVSGHDSYGSGYSADVGSSGSYGSSGHGGWGRSLDAQDLAYTAQKPKA